jgi:hypothetical protein
MGRDHSNPHDRSDGVDTVRATAADLATYEEARRQLSQMQVPLLHRADDANSRLFVMGFDGTGNDMGQQARQTWTNVALLHEQLEERRQDDRSIGTGYVAGPGTQEGFVARTRDLITGRSFESRVEEGYKQFIDQAGVWLKENPNADIKVIANGFSRGAEQSAAFTRLVHERGIQDPDGAVYERNGANEIIGVRYTRPPLVAPGQAAQVALLYDPVATGQPEKHDRRLPPSALTAFQITARDEPRDQFPSSEHSSRGVSADRRSLNAEAAGVHSNIGGSYTRNGLSDLNFNLAADYLNSVADRPFVQKRALSRDPADFVIHRSDQHQRIYTTRGMEDGERDRVQRLAPDAACRPRGPCDDREPVDERLAARFEWRSPVVTVDPSQPVPEPTDSRPFWQRGESPPAPTAPRTPVDDLFDRLSISAATRDATAMRDASRNYVETDGGQQWLQGGREQNAAQAAEQAAERARQIEAQRAPAPEAPEVAAPVMRR